MKKIAVLGAGSWGTILASLLEDNGHDVKLYGNIPEVNDEINTKHTNTRYMKRFSTNEKLVATLDLAEAVKDAEIILSVLPTGAVRIVMKNLAPILEESAQKPVIVSATKGIEPVTTKRVSEMIREELVEGTYRDIAVLSGPSHAENVAEKDLTALAIATSDNDIALEIQEVFSNDYLRLYSNEDLLGVELGGSIKNVIAIGAGIISGLGFQDDARAALITRGLAEMTRLGVAMGANPLTFSGLAGIGDLIVTATSVNSRNWRAGNSLAHGKTLQETLDHMGMVVEGVETSKAVHELSKKYDVDMPISSAIYQILFEGKDVHLTIDTLMARQHKAEIDWEN